MLKVSLWSRIVVALILLAGIFIALPNEPHIRNVLPSWFPTKTVTLGLDLQGGSYLLLQVELDKALQENLQNLLGDVRAGFNKRPRIGYSKIEAKGDTFTVRVTDPARLADARKILNDLNPQTTSSLLGTGGARAYDITEPGDGVFVMKMTEAYKNQTKQQILEQSVQVVNKRIDELGTREPTVQRQGEDRILVQVPGLSDPSHLKALLGKTAKLTFQLVDVTADYAAAQRGNVPIDDELLPQQVAKGQPPLPPILVKKRIMVGGNNLTNATSGFSPQTGQPEVIIRFDSTGARLFGDVTKANVGRPFAIVLDKQVISAPRINEPILGGTASITGSYTPAEANDLAVLLRAGALPTPLSVIEERTVGAELGTDSINAGSYAAAAGLVLVALFMIARYGLFGVFADIALTLNMVLLLAVLSVLGATLTLPGIAGMVLTMGMAVDANVLIYERIREEVRNGRTMLAAIDSGFKRAMATIIDANMTHLIAAAILFQFGTGPVRGFAVTLGLGIITSFFTAVMVTRLIVIAWLNIRKPRRLYI
jgi:protein-export membrane protein SecD